ncbi:dihydroorotate dehydrogenase [Serendipita sp. 401]|nr:dihydroorotate dehydrogenase [Serendipita sp. 401]KAG9053197.1 dihydroorotate dehydrogenase [Serendipita sp. 407]
MSTGAPFLRIEPPLLNSACPWASTREDLQALFDSSSTGAVTTRTATLNGFEEDAKVHQVAFNAAQNTSLNSYGYSPYPLSNYIAWVKDILTSGVLGPKKPFIISITSSHPSELRTMLGMIQDLRRSIARDSFSGTSSGEYQSIIGVELNTSCPNIPDKPPPAYAPLSREFLDLLKPMAEMGNEDESLVLGLKLPPYVYRRQMIELVEAVATFANAETGRCPFRFFTCTNTLGGCVMFQDQTGSITDQDANPLALPTKYGGLAGEPLHSLALGNVMSFKEILTQHPIEEVRQIGIIGVGGVTSPEAYRRMLKAGATAVACATALGVHGVGVFDQLIGGN